MMPRTLLLNADVGEGMPGDHKLIPTIDMANVAAGAHAGGGEVLSTTVAKCREAGVTIGAHPSYPDEPNFGRISMWGKVPPPQLNSSFLNQIMTVAEAVEKVNGTVSYVKPHGALYHDIAHNWAVAEFFAMSVTLASRQITLPSMPPLPIMVLAGSTGHRYLQERGYSVIPEAFADRAYGADGSLVPRGENGSVISEPDLVKQRIEQFLTSGHMPTIEGDLVKVEADTLCVNSFNGDI